MTVTVTSRKTELERAIHASRAATLGAYIEYIEALDDRTDWPTIVSSARAAGVEKETFKQALSCSWPTVTRWMAGQAAPGVFTRTAMKQTILSLVAKKHQDELRLAAKSVEVRRVVRPRPKTRRAQSEPGRRPAVRPKAAAERAKP